MDTKVKVKVLHNRSHPGTKWVEAIDWTPATDWAPGDWQYMEGTLWSAEEEEAGLALATDADEGDEITIPLAEVFWSATGNVKYLRQAAIESEVTHQPKEDTPCEE